MEDKMLDDGYQMLDPRRGHNVAKLPNLMTLPAGYFTDSQIKNGF
ncbi:MAG: hypothetical protein JWM28_293 [Chitinophagaceae bacterium]|nr:hypothetical protein [Chitinophagaceae bacterium]